MPSPEILFNFSKKCLQRRIINFLSSRRSNSEFFDFQRSLFAQIPPVLIDVLMNEVLLHLSEQMNQRKRILLALHLLLSERSRTLCIYPFNYSLRFESDLEENSKFFNKVLAIIKRKASKLTYLELNYEFMKLSDLKAILQCLPTLEKLTLKAYDVRDDFMQVVLSFCPSLRELSLIVSFLHFKKIKIRSWPKHETLRVFRLIKLYPRNFLNSFLITREEIVEKFPNLEIVESSEDFLNFSKSFLPASIPENLKALLSEESLSMTAIRQLHQISPEMNFFELSAPQDGVVAFLQNFRHLKRITFNDCDSQHMMELLARCGSQLESLTLNLRGINLSRVLETCPNLRFLDLNFSSDLIVEESRGVTRHKLKHLHLVKAPANLIDFLRGVTSLHVLRVHSWRSYDPASQLDDFISTLKEIRILHIYTAKQFTLKCIEQIIRHCHKLQEIVVPLFFVQFNIKQITEFIDKNNFHVKCMNVEGHYFLHKNLP